jgi:hypothetical protein
MRGLGRASPFHSGLLLAQFDTVFNGVGGESLRLRRDTAVVLHGRSPQLRLMIGFVIRGLAPNSALTRSRNECQDDLSRQVATRVELDPVKTVLEERMAHGGVWNDARDSVEGWEWELCGINELWRDEG